MNARQFAIVGVRLLGLTAMSIGLVCLAAGVYATIASGDLSRQSLQLHDTYIVVSSGHLPLMLGVFSILIGGVLMFASRRVGAFLARDLD